MNIIMHSTTAQYLYTKIMNGYKLNVPCQVSVGSFSIYGIPVLANDSVCQPTIDEPSGWIFPKNKFITYGPEDEETCRYCNLGRQGRGLILGDIYMVDTNLLHGMNLELMTTGGLATAGRKNYRRNSRPMLKFA